MTTNARTPQAPSRNASDAFAWLGGANLAVLSRAPTARGKFVQMGFVLLTTASIAAISMTFFIHQEVSEPEFTAALIGIFWGLVIFNLDRFLVVSMGATRDRGRLLLMAVPRLLLAVVISLVVSTPITLRIFQSDINNQLQTSHLAQSAAMNGMAAKSEPAAEAQQLNNEINADEAQANGTLAHQVTNPQLTTAQQQVATLQPQVATAKQQEITAYEAWQCELYGDDCAAGSGRSGDGPIAQAKQQTYEQTVANYNSLNNELQMAQQGESQAEAALKGEQSAALTRSENQAKVALPGMEAQYKQAENELAQMHSTDQTVIGQDDGTLAQLSALWTASAGNAMLLLAHLTVMALFFLIELLPVLVKILLNVGPPDVYETVLQADEETDSEKARTERLRERRRAVQKLDEEKAKEDADSQRRIKVAEDKSKYEQDIGLKANAYVAGKMEAVLDTLLQQWSTQVMTSLNNAQGGNWSPPSSNSSNGSNGNASAQSPNGVPNSGGAAVNGTVPPQGFGLIPPGNKL
jgi:hypothetical protein